MKRPLSFPATILVRWDDALIDTAEEAALPEDLADGPFLVESRGHFVKSTKKSLWIALDRYSDGRFRTRQRIPWLMIIEILNETGERIWNRETSQGKEK